MIIKNDQREQFLELARPLMKWMSENLHPHTRAVISYDRAELDEVSLSLPIDDYILD